MIAEKFQSDLLLIKTDGTIQDQNDFFSILFQRQESWGDPYVTNYSYLGTFMADRGMQDKIRTVIQDGDTFREFESFIDVAYGMGTFVTGWQNNLSAADFAYYLTAAGIYQRPLVAGLPTTTLTASNGTVLATGIVTAAAWESNWNTLRVPYERVTLGNPIFPYIKNLAAVGENPVFFRQSRQLFP